MRAGPSPIRVLIVGQTPPPFHGQAAMIDVLLRRPMPGVERRHVRMAYSSNMVEMGSVQPGKVLHLLGLIARILTELIRHRPDVVYYPPSGPSHVPIFRDVLTLLAVRPFCRSLVFHFHAGGLSEVWPRVRARPVLGWLFRRAYFGADAAIMMAPSTPPDGQVLQAKRIRYVPYGIEDAAGDLRAAVEARRTRDRPQVLFVGVHLESKGVLVLARACVELWERGHAFDLHMVGECSSEVQAAIRGITAGHEESVRLHGVLTGAAKWRRYAEADVFCFPTFFESEAFPVVCLEAMMFALPILATRWRGVPDIVADGETGVLAEPRDPQALAAQLEILLKDPALREQLGEAGRRHWEERFTLDAYVDRVRGVLLEVGAAARPKG